MRAPIRSANSKVLASSEPLPSAKVCAVSLRARKNGRAWCRKVSLYLVGFATLKLTLEIILDMARLPQRAQFSACFSVPAPRQSTSVTAWHFAQRNSKSGIQNLRAPRRVHSVKLFEDREKCQIISRRRTATRPPPVEPSARLSYRLAGAADAKEICTEVGNPLNRSYGEYPKKHAGGSTANKEGGQVAAKKECYRQPNSTGHRSRSHRTNDSGCGSGGRRDRRQGQGAHRAPKTRKAENREILDARLALTPRFDDATELVKSLNLFRLKLLISILLLPSITFFANAAPAAAKHQPKIGNTRAYNARLRPWRRLGKILS